MSRNVRRENAKTRSIQTTVQVFLVLVGIGLLVTGLALAASGMSVNDAMDTVSDEWGDPASTETGTETETESTPDGSGGGDDEATGDDESADDDTSQGGSDDGAGDEPSDDETESDDGADDDSGDADDGDAEDDRDDSEQNASADAHALTVLVEDGDGDPLENATVAVDPMGDADSSDETETNDDGEAAFNLTDGEYEVTASADGYEDATDTVEIDGDDETLLLTLEADDDGDEAEDGDETDGDDEYRTLTVFVVDDSGDPLENATVEIAEQKLLGDSDDAETDDNGRAEFAVQDGQYDLTASADDFEDAEREVEIDGDDEEVLLRLEKSGSGSS